MRRRLSALGVVAAVVTGASSPAWAGPAVSEAAGGDNVVVYEGQLRSDGTVSHTQREVRTTVRSSAAEAKPDEPARGSSGKLDPQLAAALGQAGALGSRQQVVITFQEDLKVPRLPEPDTTLPRSADANVRAQAEADGIVANVKAQRRAGYQTLSSDLERLHVRTLDTFWLVKGVVADAPLAALPELVKRADVQYIEPVTTGAPPPADTDPDNDEEDARALIRTDPYFNLGQTGGYIGLLDTGVRATHTLFTNPSHLAFREDLTNPTNPNPDDDCWNHGTSTAAIITGNGNLGAPFRGITGITLDSFKIYPSGCGNLDTAAAINGFQRAVNVLDRVIVAEIQATGTETSSLSQAADAAYDAGAVVIAANGNSGPNASTVAAPAVAQKALGIGATDLKTQVVPDYSGRGPAPDGRIKPDLLAPTNVETASSASSTATQVFTGTSAATPHAAGAAALVRNFLRGSNFNIDPGQVYAYMIANGSIAYPFDNTSGAGLIRLSVNGSFWRSQATIGNLQTVDIPINVAATNNRMNVGLWWPEQPATHNDIDLSLIDPSGVVRASSISASSVFERVSVAGPLAAGTWTVRIRGFNVPSGTQLVHWAAVTTSP
jgi:hypothetical protein